MKKKLFLAIACLCTQATYTTNSSEESQDTWGRKPFTHMNTLDRIDTEKSFQEYQKKHKLPIQKIREQILKESKENDLETYESVKITFDEERIQNARQQLDKTIKDKNLLTIIDFLSNKLDDFACLINETQKSNLVALTKDSQHIQTSLQKLQRTLKYSTYTVIIAIIGSAIAQISTTLYATNTCS